VTARLARRFAALKQEGRAGLVTFTMCGDPDKATALDILRGLPGAGADIIEIGMPHSDPIGDGPVIQLAGNRALKAGTKMADVLDAVRSFRKADQDTPLILMGYINPILNAGIGQYFGAAADAGADGFIMVDVPLEEEGLIRGAADRAGLPIVRLVPPTADDARIAKLANGASGFLYHVSLAGVTGSRDADEAVVAAKVARIRKATTLPVAVGFGIKTAARAAAIGQVADAAVVGSALVDRIARNLTADGRAGPNLVKDTLAFVSELAAGVRAARKAA
jgi:tryptophan synthase alpha chain